MPRVGDDLDSALAAQHFDTARVGPGWRLVQALQLLLLVGAIGGGAWWAAEAGGQTSATSLWGFPYGMWVLVVGIGAGLVLALAMVWIVRLRASSFAAACGDSFAEAVESVVLSRVIEPIDKLVSTYRRSRELLLSVLDQA